MKQMVQRKWLAFWLFFVTACSGVLVVNGAFFDLDAYVSFSVLDELGAALDDGSVIYIFGSSDAINDGMFPYVDGTSIVANSTLGDDVFLGTARIGDNATNAGTFFTTLQYDPDEVNYVYIRVFNTTNIPVAGTLYWQTSGVFVVSPTLGVAQVDFNPNDDLETTNPNNFVIIPEPSTGNIMVLFFAMLGGIRSRMKRQQREDELKKEGEEAA